MRNSITPKAAAPSRPELHPLCAIFPPLPTDELARLAADIRTNGLREPIALFEERVLDGQNRLAACAQAGVEPTYADLPPDTDVVGFVIAKNVSRRHLDLAQRAMIAARLANCLEGRPRKTASNEAVSQTRAAELTGVPRTAVQRAARIIQKAIPALVDAVAGGRVPLAAAAKLSASPAAEQKERLEAILAGGGGKKRSQKTPAANTRRAPSSAPLRLVGPPPFKPFGVRISEQLDDELQHALEHELAGVQAWTPVERQESLERLLAVRSKLDQLITGLKGVIDAS